MSLSQTQPLPSRERSPLPGWTLLILPLLFVQMRCIFACMNELAADEAYYRAWSTQLSWGYLDHPPMIAWLIAGSCALLGRSEFAVRLPAILLAGGTMQLAARAGGLIGISRQGQFRLQLVLFCFPILHVLGTIATPDTPAMFFVMLAMVAALQCLNSPARWRHWLLLGAAAGCAMHSKYTALLPLVAIFFYLLLHDPRRWYRSAVAGIVAGLLIAPLLYWNHQRDWLSFVFQFRHGTSADGRGWLINLADYIGAQLLVATPILAVLCVWLMIRLLRSSASPGQRMVSIASLGTLAFFALISLRYKVEGNWPVLAWIPAIILLASFLPTAGEQARRAARSGTILAAIASFVLMLPPALLDRVNPHTPLGQIGGWAHLARNIKSAVGDLPIICLRYQDASLFDLYLATDVPIRALRRPGDRLTQFDLMPISLPEGKFALVSDAPLEPGSRMTLLHGEDSIEVEVISATHHAVRVDELTIRGRFVAICRSARRDAATNGG